MKVLIFDVDGTVCDSCQEMGHFMSKFLKEREETLVFISGTDADELERMVSSQFFRKDHYIFGSSGASAFYNNGAFNMWTKKLWDLTLSPSETKFLINTLKDFCKQHDLIPLTTQEDQILDRGSQITLSILGRKAPSEVKEKYDPDKKIREMLVKKLAPLIDDKFELKIGGTTSIDITLKGVNKAWALEKFILESGFSKKDILYFGDQLQEGGNDHIVKQTGITCIEVTSPEDTLKKLRMLLDS